MRWLIPLILFAVSIPAQNVKVISVKKLDLKGKYYFPEFSTDDSKLLITSENFKGIYLLNLKNNKLKTISNENGAGYKPEFTDAGRSIIYRTSYYKGIKKYHNVYRFDVEKNKSEILLSNARNITYPIKFSNGDVSVLNVSTFSKVVKGNKINTISKAVFVANNKINYFNGVQTLTFQPFGKGIYVWASLSPDGNRILFTFGNKGTFLMDTDGNILKKIDFAHAPVFSPDGKWIAFMRDEDNGYDFTASDIFVVSLKSGKIFKITNTTDRIEMYPRWSNDGKKLTFHDTQGEIFVAELILTEGN